MCTMCNTESETVSHFVLHCPYFSVRRNIFFMIVLILTLHDFSLNNESRKLSYISDFRCPRETVRYCFKYIESIYIRHERFVQLYMWRYFSTCLCRRKVRISHNILQIRYGVHCSLEFMRNPNTCDHAAYVFAVKLWFCE